MNTGAKTFEPVATVMLCFHWKPGFRGATVAASLAECIKWCVFRTRRGSENVRLLRWQGRRPSWPYSKLCEHSSYRRTLTSTRSDCDSICSSGLHREEGLSKWAKQFPLSVSSTHQGACKQQSHWNRCFSASILPSSPVSFPPFLSFCVHCRPYLLAFVWEMIVIGVFKSPPPHPSSLWPQGLAVY